MTVKVTSKSATKPSLFEKGSLWRKWDLHIHSPLTILNNQYPRLQDGTPDWEAFITKLESLDAAVVAITDYFTIDGYKKIKECKKQGRLNNIHTILPNIEFRLNNVVASKKDGQQPRRLNFHVIFSDEVSEQDIEEHFLHDIDFFYEANPQDQDQRRKLKTSNLEALGKKLKEQHQPFEKSGDSPLVVGAKQAVVNHEDITKLLQDSRFKGKYILVFPEEYSNLIDWDGQDHHTRKTLLQKSDMVFSASDKTREWCLGRPPYNEGVEKYLEEFKTLKPCIHGSDAHKLDEVGHPCALRGEAEHTCQANGDGCLLRFCWIKADPTFEGLKQLLYEPNDRVHIGPNDPTLPRSNFTLERVHIGEVKVNDELTIKETSLELNHGLVAVTGGKGSGKTALLDLIANCFLNRRHTGDKNSFVRRVADECVDLEIGLTFKDGVTFSKELGEDKFFENSELIYIAQGQLEDYIGDQSDLDSYIRTLIFESAQIRDTVLSFEFSELGKDIAQIERDLTVKNKLVVDLEKSTSASVYQTLELERKQKEAELKDLESRIAEYEKTQGADRIKVAQDKQKVLSDLKAKKDGLVRLRDLIDEARNFVDQNLASFNNLIVEINTALVALKIEEKYENVTYAQKGLLDARLNTVRAEITDTVKKIDEAQREVAKLEASVQDHATALDQKAVLQRALDIIKEKEVDLAKKKQSLESAIKDRRNLLKKLFATVLEQKKKYEEIITAFSEQKAEVLSDLSFNANVRFDTKRFLDTAEEVLDNRRVTNVRSADDTESAFAEMLKLVHEVTAGDESKIDQLVNEVERLNEEYKGKLKAARTISIANYYSCLYSNYLHIVPTVKYKNTLVSKLSLGQKATVLIKIYLAQGLKPIIIDSHDDHLDNEFIMDELVKAIRQAKRYRQIILASNNGNVVVNSDAEQLIIANRADGEISYIAGSLENPPIRDRALKVLEGGTKAFRQRQQKYRLNM